MKKQYKNKNKNTTQDANEKHSRPYPERSRDRKDLICEPTAAYRMRQDDEAEAETPDHNPDDGMRPPASTPEFPRQGSYTVEDYYTLPDERRFELIDGYLIEMEAPSLLHQSILGELFFRIYRCIEEKANNCRVFFSPLDVQLDRDNRTMVQPDLLVICEFDQYDGGAYQGAPEFIAEVLSASTRAHDMLRKRRKYEAAGVREYWIIDPDYEQVYVWFFEENARETVYSFDSVIELWISEGGCAIDFGEIHERVGAFLR